MTYFKPPGSYTDFSIAQLKKGGNLSGGDVVIPGMKKGTRRSPAMGKDIVAWILLYGCYSTVKKPISVCQISGSTPTFASYTYSPTGAPAGTPCASIPLLLWFAGTVRE